METGGFIETIVILGGLISELETILQKIYLKISRWPIPKCFCNVS